MRVIIKGGVWKNTEDEILKAAVMKYGKNQWSRIASLLNRKTAAQCKARWYEWLDPSIKKTEWSREEEEKLLHLAKIMPCQWRTIAPLVGRTAAQCLEHYEKLLDAAAGKSDEGTDDPRKLRPGEIDPTPETKPALPDPVDMEEDEKEMLQEARARLANTRGKKAKRKAREKQLEEARRLAMLQKRRELKAAGMDVAKFRPKTKGAIDYNKEIPFQRKAPAGFFDATEEQNLTAEKKNFKSMSLKQLEGGQTRREREEQLREEDLKKKKEKEKKVPAAIADMDKPWDAKKTGRRSKLTLPEPQVSDRELHEIAKLSYDPSAAEGDATSSLLSSYTATPARGPGAQTPAVERTPARPDTVMSEAQNLIRLNAAQTPLLGEDNPELNPSDFSSALPKHQQMMTPNPLATPLRTPGGQPQNRRGATPRHTPIRDQLNINTPQVSSGGIGGSDLMSMDPRHQRNQVLLGLSSLPAPKKAPAEIDIQPALQELKEAAKAADAMEVDTDRVGTAVAVADAAEVARKDEARRVELESRRLKLRSTVLRRGDLPRPPSVPVPPLLSKLEVDIEQLESYEDRADELVQAEIASILAHDALEFAVPEGAKVPRGIDKDALRQHFSALDEKELYEAEQLLENELVELRLQYGEYPLEEYLQAWEKNVQELIYIPDAADGIQYKLASRATPLERSAALGHQFEQVKNDMKAQAKKVQAIEKKVAIYHGGYIKRNENLVKQIGQLRTEIEQTSSEIECLNSLRKTEVVAGPQRIRDLQADVQRQLDRENQLQVRYANLLAQRQQMLLQMQANS